MIKTWTHCHWTVTSGDHLQAMNWNRISARSDSNCSSREKGPALRSRYGHSLRVERSVVRTSVGTRAFLFLHALSYWPGGSLSLLCNWKWGSFTGAKQQVNSAEVNNGIDVYRCTYGMSWWPLSSLYRLLISMFFLSILIKRSGIDV